MASFGEDENKVKKGFDPRISSEEDPESEAEAEAEDTTDKKYKALSYAKYCSVDGKDLKSIKYKPQNMDHMFLLVNSVIIFFMQCGFAFMEAGAVR